MEQQETFDDRFWGFEFDWFALDKDGRIALLSSGGYGNVPIEAQKNYQVYDSIVETFQLPNYGNPEVWRDYTKYGLYVFDWHHYEGPYQKVATPYFYQTIPATLRDRILEIKGLLQLDVSFKAADSITIMPDGIFVMK